MDPAISKAFDAVVTFSDALNGLYEKEDKITPSVLYNRLLDHVEFKNYSAINDFLGGFKSFIVEHEEILLNGDLTKIPKNACIRYKEGSRAYIEIGKIVHENKNDPDVLNVIRTHILSIFVLLFPELDMALSALTKFTKEAEEQPQSYPNEGFNAISMVVDKLKDVAREKDIDQSNPAEGVKQLVTGLVEGGAINEIFAALSAAGPSSLVGFISQLGGGSLYQGMERTTQPTRNKVQKIEEVDQQPQQQVSQKDQ